MNTLSKDIKHIKHAQFIALNYSKDPDTKVGALIVSPDNSICNTGYNGIPRNLKDTDERLNRPEKYKWVLHAECNAILNSAREGTRVNGCTMFVTHYPCPHCAAMIINSGIHRVVVSEQCMSKDFTDRYASDILFSRNMFQESGILLDIIKL